MKKTPLHRGTLIFTVGFITVLILVSSNNTPISHTRVLAQSSTAIYLPLIEKQSPYNWLQFNGDPSHSGNNTLETQLSPGTAGNLKLLFQVSLPGVADGAPVYLSGVSTPSGVRDMLYVTTTAGQIAALDAHSGVLVWSKQYGPAGCLINNSLSRNEPCYTTSSPAIDPGHQFVYSYGLDGFVHKYAVGNGIEVKTGGWPELATLKPYDEKGSSALSIAEALNGTSYLYVALAGYPGDAGNYQGHLTAINLSDGTQKVFNTLCSNQAVHFVDSRLTSGPDCYPNTMSAIWSRPGVVYDPYHDRILIATGNGTFNPTTFMWGDTIISLNPDGSSQNGSPLDSYTPANYQYLQDNDLDLGSSAPAILPPAPGKYPHLAVQGGKDGVLRLINLDQLSGQVGAGNVGGEVFSMPLPMGGLLLAQPAIWVNPADLSTWVFVTDYSGTSGLRLTVNASGDPSLVQQWSSAGGTSPLVANDVVLIAQSGMISAYKATDGTLLWSDTQVGPIHWESPVVVNGVVYITDQSGKLTAYSLP